MTAANVDITAETPIPDLLARYPHTRGVLDEHGLRGCGGEHGPAESLGFYARMHGVDLPALLTQLRQAVAAPQTAPKAAAASVADSLYRRFFLTGMLVILTVGASWGAIILWQIGYYGSFTGVSIHHINAHGHAQIFGWVGLFIMGFAYQAFPRFWQTELVKPNLAVAVFGLMVAGLAIRVVTLMFGGSVAEHLWIGRLGLAGGVMQVIATSVFMAQLVATFRRSIAAFEPWILYIFLAMGWFIVQTVFSVWHGWNMGMAPTREAMLHYVSTYQPALRDMQVYGLSVMMILGVSQRLFPPFLGVRATPVKRAWIAAGLLTVATVAQVTMYITFRLTGQTGWAAGLVGAWVLLTIGVAMVALPWRLWQTPPNENRSIKFVRIAYLWLAVALAMLLLMPLYQWISGLMFSHAYYGAIRHAITVGFISMMIVGVAAKVVPTLNGVDTYSISPLWGPFILLNVGCLLRVVFQVGTDWHDSAFRLVGVSSLLEVAALTWWAVHLAGIILRGWRPASDQDDTAASTEAPAVLTLDHRVTDILRWHPRTQSVFDAHGFALLRNPVMRRTVARHITVAQAAAHRGVDAQKFLAALQAATAPAAPKASPPTCGCGHDHAEHPPATATVPLGIQGRG